MTVLIPGFFGAMLGVLCLLLVLWICHEKIHDYLQNFYCKHEWKDLNEITDDEGKKRALAQECIHCKIKTTQPLIPSSRPNCKKDGHHWELYKVNAVIRGIDKAEIGKIFYLQCMDCGEITSRKEEL